MAFDLGNMLSSLLAVRSHFSIAGANDVRFKTHAGLRLHAQRRDDLTSGTPGSAGRRHPVPL
jgi:hypothetical protein